MIGQGATSAAVDLQRIGLKVFFDEPSRPRPQDVIPIFHRWIEEGALEDLLVDIADYRHLAQGPVVVLVGHEGNYSLDMREGRMGLEYSRKQPMPGALADRLRVASRLVLTAAELLESEPSFGGRVRFRGDELQVFANDRLEAPSTQETVIAFRDALMECVRPFYGEATCDIEADSDPRDRLMLTVRASGSVRVQTLLDRLRSVPVTVDADRRR